MVHGRLPPLIWALGKRPVVLLPEALWEQLTPQQRTALLAHEIAHLKRRDHCLRWLELAVLALYWWRPVAWWASRELGRAAERCCDAWVLWALPDLATAYGTALLDTIDFLAGPRAAPPPAAPGFGHVRHLKVRLEAIASGCPSPRLSPGVRRGAVLAALFVLPCSPWLWQGVAAPSGGQATLAAVRELDGSWVVSSVVQDGESVPEEDIKKMRYIVAGDRHTFQFADLRFTGVHRLHPAERPKAIDIELTGSRLAGEFLILPPAPNEGAVGQPSQPDSACRGIYEVQGDVLKLCVAFGRPRPDAFSSPAGSGRMLVVYRRANN